jgi:RNA polymerase sigma-70 factor (ECF subfamily)
MAMQDHAALLAGDPAAWDRMVRELLPLLKGLAQRNFSKYGYSADPATCEDICSNIWHQLLADDRRLLRSCLEENRLLPMLHTLARNRCIDHIRKFRKLSFSDTEVRDEEEEHAPAHGAGLEREWLLRHIRALPPRERLLIELFYLQDLSYHDIHQVSGIPENSIGPTLQRALKHLRQRIESEENHVH